MYNILICDDQRDIVNALKIYLAPEGYRLYEAYTGAEALKLVKEQDIHLVLLDVMMPQMDGITATAKIREFSNVPIILLTAKSETEDKVLGLNVGADDFVTKPVVPWRCWPESAASSGAMTGWARSPRKTPDRSPSAASSWTTAPRPSPSTAIR